MRTSFRAATNNIMSLPENPEVLKTLKAAPLATVVLVQEADLPSFHTALKKLGAHRVTAKVPDGDVYSCFVLYDPAIWDHVSTTFHRAYVGSDGVSLTRHVAETVLRHKGIDREFAFLSYHAVTAGKDAVRKRLRKQGTKAVRARIKAQRAAGRPIVLGCDQNGTANLFWSRTAHVRHLIDHIYVWSSADVKVKIDKHHTVATRSDHDALVALIIAACKS